MLGFQRLHINFPEFTEHYGSQIAFLGLSNLLGISQLTVHFTPGEFNKIADMFSRCNEQTIFELILCKTNEISEDLWKHIHRGHFGVDKTWANLQRITNEFTRKEVEDENYDIVASVNSSNDCKPSDPLHSFS